MDLLTITLGETGEEQYSSAAVREEAFLNRREVFSQVYVFLCPQVNSFLYSACMFVYSHHFLKVTQIRGVCECECEWKRECQGKKDQRGTCVVSVMLAATSATH